MKISFHIHYATLWGQSIEVAVTYIASDGKERSYRLPMNTDDGELWTLETAVMESRQRTITALRYHYRLLDGQQQVIRTEWDKVPRLYAYDPSMTYVFHDQWRDTPLHEHLYTTAVRTTAGLPRTMPVRAVKMPLFRKTLLFRVAAPQIGNGQSVAILGNHPSLGEWNTARYLPMTHVGGAEWMLTVNFDHFRWPLEYKYVVVDDASHNIAEWEEGDNRTIEQPRDDEGMVHVFCGGSLRISGIHWKAAGTALPLFALRSERSYGVGDLGDLHRVVAWAACVGMKIIQLLPINDTTATHSWTDSHPYNAISAFAIHPQYIDLEALPLNDKAKAADFHRKRRELNALPYTDYPAVQRVKEAYIDALVEEREEEWLADEDYRRFVGDNEKWLRPYAAFSILRDRHHTARFTDWGDDAVYQPQRVTDLLDEQQRAYHRICIVQWLLHSQLAKVSSEAHNRKVALMGDMPIGIYRDSVEVWTHPQLFDCRMQVGTMPDAQHPYGQNWGFPAYRWDDIATANTSSGERGREETVTTWFHRRLAFMERYFDLLRIDHMGGWFRSWVIPGNAVHATLGHFAPALPLGEEEIAHYGLPFRRQLFTRPFINDSIIERFFGLHADYVRQRFLHRMAYGFYALQENVDSQAKVMALLGGQTDENSVWIRDGLLRLLSNVLFVEDDRQPGMYHPRIMAYQLPVYEALSTEEKEAFMRLYNHFFFERHRQFWQHTAMQRISRVFAHTSLLLCAENIGDMPDGYEQVLDRQRILTMVMQTVPQRYEGEFAHIEAWPYLSLATTSTHDMPTMRMMWEENAGRTQRYYATMLQKQGRAPRHLPAHIAEEIIARHLYGPSMLCVLPIQDWLAIDTELRSKEADEERVNAPYDPYNQWRFRMQQSVDDLDEAVAMNRKMMTMITRSGR